MIVSYVVPECSLLAGQPATLRKKDYGEILKMI